MVILMILWVFLKNLIKEVWLKTMASDKRFIKINLLIAMIFFDMDVEKDYFEGLRK